MSTTERKYKRVFESIIKKLNFGGRIRRKVGEWAHITGAQGVCNLGTFWEVGYVYLYKNSECKVGEWAHITGAQGVCNLGTFVSYWVSRTHFQRCCLYVYILPHVGRICEIQSE